MLRHHGRPRASSFWIAVTIILSLAVLEADLPLRWAPSVLRKPPVGEARKLPGLHSDPPPEVKPSIPKADFGERPELLTKEAAAANGVPFGEGREVEPFDISKAKVVD
ncbi:MAG: hypothetical protein ACREA0_00990, partial [bacterium]